MGSLVQGVVFVDEKYFVGLDEDSGDCSIVQFGQELRKTGSEDLLCRLACLGHFPDKDYGSDKGQKEQFAVGDYFEGSDSDDLEKSFKIFHQSDVNIIIG